jgi:electron transfer flavoprotein alpha subunit
MPPLEPTLFVLGDHDQGQISPGTWEGLGLAEEIQRHHPAPVKIILLGDAVEGPAAQAAEETRVDVLAVKVPGLSYFQPEIVLQVLQRLFFESPPACLIMPHNSRSWELAPRIALRSGLACIPGVTKILQENGRLLFRRSLFQGKILADLAVETQGAVLTFESGYFKFSSSALPGNGSWELKNMPPFESRTELLEISPAVETEAALREAEVIVAAGRGIGPEETLNLIHRLAALFPRSAVAGSRPLCDLGWLPYNRQVGQTGSTVHPRLYLACGISGAYQHIAGMKDSDFIVSVNRDPQAAIGQWSDVCIEEDLKTFLPLLIESVQKIREGQGYDQKRNRGL